MSHWRKLGDLVTSGSNLTLRFYRKIENQEKRGTEMRSSTRKRRRKGERYDTHIRSTPGD